MNRDTTTWLVGYSAWGAGDLVAVQHLVRGAGWVQLTVDDHFALKFLCRIGIRHHEHFCIIQDPRERQHAVWKRGNAEFTAVARHLAEVLSSVAQGWLRGAHRCDALDRAIQRVT